MEQKKKALGKGLEELFSSEVLDFDTFESNIMENTPANDVKEIPVNEIRPNPYQPRKTFNEEALNELAESIKNYGVFQPIIVKKSIKGYDLIAGERRLRASKLAGMETIPAIVKEFSDEEMREISLLENIQRENLTAIELAWAYKGIIDNLDIRQEDLAKKIVIQAKNYSGNVGNKAVQEAFAAKSHYNCHLAMVITNSYFTKSAQEVSKTTGVVLVDRDKLEEIIKNGKMAFLAMIDVRI